jgi:hypothetical protein
VNEIGTGDTGIGTEIGPSTHVTAVISAISVRSLTDIFVLLSLICIILVLSFSVVFDINDNK